jgi:hypothetical protein
VATTSLASTTSEAVTTTTTKEQRLAEVEELLRDLWFGWFDAIYRKDADALWQVVATSDFHGAGVAAMDSMEFESAPTQEGVVIPTVEVLLDRPDCLVAFHEVDVSSFRGDGAVTQTVSVLWPDDRYGFRFATGWQFKNDLWQMDCDNLERQVTP